METWLSASCFTFALKPRCHCPNPLHFLLLDLFTAAQGLSWRCPSHFWALGLSSSSSNTVWYLTRFPSARASFLLLLTPVYLIDSGLTFQASFWFFFFFFAFPCIFHDLPLNGVHPPEQSCFFQCISCFLCQCPLCSRMSTVGASYEPASCHSNRSHTGKSPGLKGLCQMQAIEFEEFCFSYKKSSERHWTPKAEWHRYKIPIELWAGF